MWQWFLHATMALLLKSTQLKFRLTLQIKATNGSDTLVSGVPELRVVLEPRERHFSQFCKSKHKELCHYTAFYDSCRRHIAVKCLLSVVVGRRGLLLSYKGRQVLAENQKGLLNGRKLFHRERRRN